MGECNSNRDHNVRGGTVVNARFMFSILVLFLLVGISNAALDWDITEDTTIDSGSYGIVTIDYETPASGSVVSITGGDIEILKSYESSIVEVYAGTTIGNVWATDVSTVNIYGGTINSVSSDRASVVNLHYLTPHGWDVYTGISSTGTLNIYGYGFEWTYNTTSADFSGYWLNGDPITFHFRDYQQNDLNRINIVPEPASIVLLGLSFLAIRKGTTS